MQTRKRIFILFLFLSTGVFGQASRNDTAFMDSLEVIMFPADVHEDINNDTIIKCCKMALAMNRKLAESDNYFFDGRLADGYWGKHEYDSVMKYGKEFVRRNVKRNEDEGKMQFIRVKSLQRLTCYEIYDIDTARHNYKEAVKYLLVQKKKFWWFGSGTGYNRYVERYYTDIMNCYTALGKKRKAARYKKLVDNREYD